MHILLEHNLYMIFICQFQSFDSCHYFDPSHLTNYLSCSLFIRLIICQSICLCIYQSIYLFNYNSLSIQLFVYLFIFTRLGHTVVISNKGESYHYMYNCITNFEDKLRTLKICTQQSIFLHFESNV